MTTPEPQSEPQAAPPIGIGWRDIAFSSVESAHIEGFALEQLIDLQRDRNRQAKAER